jgi:nicotinamide-nucleotide amidase
MTSEHITFKVAIIAIGTEVTSGEIINSNSMFLASHLTDLGFLCDLHITVPDERSLMTWSLEHAAKNHQIVFITGGLGPTSDDFTRHIIADYCEQPLVWNEDAWQSIVKRLERVGAPIAESNKQQAYFPSSAMIFANHHGTAAAFSVQHHNVLLIALPGPPREIEGLWHDSILDILRQLAPPSKAQTPLRWRCLGQSESKLGELVEAALKGSGFLTGYRSHMPYIDIKVWTPNERRAEFDLEWRPKLEAAILKWLVGRNDDDAATDFLASLPLATRIYLLDRATRGYLAKRIFSNPLPPGSQLTLITADYTSPMPPLEDGCMVITLSSHVERGAWQLQLTGSGPHKNFSEESRYKGSHNAERLCAYIGEKTLIILRQWFSQPEVSQ